MGMIVAGINRKGLYGYDEKGRIFKPQIAEEDIEGLKIGRAVRFIQAKFPRANLQLALHYRFIYNQPQLEWRKIPVVLAGINGNITSQKRMEELKIAKDVKILKQYLLEHAL